MGTGYQPDKKLWVPMGTGYQPEKNFWVLMGTGYQPEKKFWVPGPGQKKIFGYRSVPGTEKIFTYADPWLGKELTLKVLKLRQCHF